MTKLAVAALLLAWPDAGVSKVEWRQICEVRPRIVTHYYDPSDLVWHGHEECPDGGASLPDAGVVTFCTIVQDATWKEDAGPAMQCDILAFVWDGKKWVDNDTGFHLPPSEVP